ncbi:MAG: methionyl-tRNA formyltransferase [Candidatus Ozemobacteraceae bacterium]
MTKTPYKVVFMGCPDFAVPSLCILATDPDFEVVAVYCMPDRPKGRGKTLTPTPIKEFALQHGFEVRTPVSFRKQPEEIEVLKSFKPDYLVVVAYGLILPQEVLNIPKIAPVNLHASILPAYRGPSPIHYSLINGDSETGNTVMLMSKGMDEGEILSVSKTPIGDCDDLGSLHDRLSVHGAELLVRTLKSYAQGEITPLVQDHLKATYTGKISTDTAHIDWKKSAIEVRNLIFAMSPCPGAWFNDGRERIKVFRARVEDEFSSEPAGTILVQDQNLGIKIVCGDSRVLSLLELQRAGKNRICCADFVCGCRLSLNNLCDDETEE